MWNGTGGGKVRLLHPPIICSSLNFDEELDILELDADIEILPAEFADTGLYEYNVIAENRLTTSNRCVSVSLQRCDLLAVPGPSTHTSSVTNNQMPNQIQSRRETRNNVRQTFTRRRDAVKNVEKPKEYLKKDELKKIKWKRRQMCDGNSWEFTGDTTLPAELRNLETPLQFFRYFFPDDLCQKIVEESKKYYMQQNTSKPFTFNIELFKQFLGVCILTSVNHLPNLRKYWSPNIGSPTIQETMSVNTFDNIRKFLHFNDNAVLVNPDSIYDADREDRLFKLRPFINAILKTFHSVPPPQRLSLDEQVAATKNRTYLKNYNPQKPHKWGYKLWVVSSTSGFVHNFEIYTGADENFLPNEPNLGAAGNVVMRLCRILSARNHKIYFDNYYTSIPLVVYLFQRGISALGTIMRHRIPATTFIPSIQDIEKKARGFVMTRVGVMKNTPLSLVMWMDNRVVSFLSTFTGSEPIGTIKRYDRKAKARLDIQCPRLVFDYDMHMGGVDLLDAHVSRYKIRIKSRKWYHRLFYHILDLVIINAWIMWKEVNYKIRGIKKKKSLADFKEELGTTLCRIGTRINSGRGRRSSVQAKMKRKKYSKKSIVPSKDTRTDGNNHWPINKTRRMRCKNPSCERKSSWECSKCKVALCLNKTKNCFVIYHTE